MERMLVNQTHGQKLGIVYMTAEKERYTYKLIPY